MAQPTLIFSAEMELTVTVAKNVLCYSLFKWIIKSKYRDKPSLTVKVIFHCFEDIFQHYINIKYKYINVIADSLAAN